MAQTSTAHLDLPPEHSVEGMARMAREMGLPCERSEGKLRITTRLGTIELIGDGRGTTLRIAASDMAKLQALRDLLTERAMQMGLTIPWQRVARGRPANLSLARIERIVRISPSYTRVLISGDDLARFAEGGLHFRLLFGPEGADWPTTDAGGVTEWPGGMGAWHRPVYTTRSIEMSAKDGFAQICFDVFLHEGGRVTDWTRHARSGDPIAITGPNGSSMPPGTGFIGIVSDETAVPVAARILAGLAPEARGQAVLFVPDAADIQDLIHPPGVSVTWALRDGPLTPAGALRQMELPETDRFVFFAAERHEAVAARDILAARGVGKGAYHAASYWTAAPRA